MKTNDRQEDVTRLASISTQAEFQKEFEAAVQKRGYDPYKLMDAVEISRAGLEQRYIQPAQSLRSRILSWRPNASSLIIAGLLLVIIVLLFGWPRPNQQLGKIQEQIANLNATVTAFATPRPISSPANPGIEKQVNNLQATVGALVAVSVATPIVTVATPAQPAASSTPMPIDNKPLAIQINSLDEPITLGTQGIAQIGVINVYLGDKTAQLNGDTIQQDPTKPDSVTIKLSRPLLLNLLRDIPNFGMPLQLRLEVPGIQPQIAQLNNLEVEVAGADVTNQALQDAKQIFPQQGAYLWIAPDKRTTPDTEAKHPDQKPGFILLKNGDRVKILGGQDQLYHVLVVHNAADGPAAENKDGYVLRSIIDGQ
jgi:hypothetical protein